MESEINRKRKPTDEYWQIGAKRLNPRSACFEKHARNYAELDVELCQLYKTYGRTHHLSICHQIPDEETPYHVLIVSLWRKEITL